mmetsp:Transcript_2850/g.6937  ORF Transcript_2850/g.6937 Transcript_2850/m.6937 type:complete len:224 (+) Transcript_2850:410-1081(+)
MKPLNPYTQNPKRQLLSTSWRAPSLQHIHERARAVLHRTHGWVRYRAEGRKMWHHVMFEADERALVAHLIAIVWRTEHGDKATVMIHLEALVFDLVTPHHELEVVVGQEPLRDVRAEGNADAALARMPAELRTRVAPQHFAERAFLGGLAKTIDLLQVLNLHPILCEQSTVDDEHLFVENASQRQVTEDLLKQISKLHRVLCLDFSVESIHLIHRRGLVIPTA